MAPQPDRRRLRIGLFAAVGCLLLAAIGAVTLDLARCHIPDFYLRAAPARLADLEALGDRCARQALDLASSARRRGPWQAAFTADQLNAWLAVDLPKEFPDLLPSGYLDPRVALEAGRGRIGIVAGDASPCVYSLDFSLFRASETALGVRIHRVRLGAIPLPLGAVVSEISAAAARGAVPLVWRQERGDPVAIISIAQDDSDYAIALDAIDLRDGELILSGRTRMAASAKHAPRGPTRQ